MSFELPIIKTWHVLCSRFKWALNQDLLVVSWPEARRRWKRGVVKQGSSYVEGSKKIRKPVVEALLYSVLGLAILGVLRWLVGFLVERRFWLLDKPAVLEDILFIFAAAVLLFGLLLRSIRKVRGFEESLTASEGRFTQITRALPVGVLIVKGNRCIFSNVASSWITGYFAKELVEMDVLDLFGPGYRDVAKQRFSTPPGDSTGASHDEIKIVSRDGGERWVDLSVARLPSEGQDALLVTLNDLTRRKRADLLQNAIYRISEAGQSAATLDELFKAINKILGLLMNAKNCYVALYDDQAETLSFPYWVDEKDPRPVAGKLWNGVTAHVIRRGKAALFSRQEMEKMRESGELAVNGSTPALDWLGVPLLVNGRVTGVLAVQNYTEKSRYREEDKEILQFVSSQIAMAIERKRTHDSARERSAQIMRHQKGLLRIAALEDTELKPALRSITRITGEVLDASEARLWLLNPEGTKATCKEIYDPLAEDRECLSSVLVADCPVFFHALEEHHSIVMEKVSSDPRMAPLVGKGVQFPETVSRLDAPLRLHGRLIGFYGYETKDAERRWSQEEQNFAASAAELASMVVATAERRKIEHELNRQRAYFQQLFDNSPEAIVVLDNSDRILRANPGFERVFGWRPEEVVGKTVNELLVPPGEVEDASRISRSVLGKGVIKTERNRLRKDGTLVVVDILGYPIIFGPDQVGVFGIYRDITDRKKAEKRLYKLAHYDSLTGLPNRILFCQRFEEALNRRESDGNNPAVLYLDVDRFKEINDALGHELGDRILVQASRRLLENTPQGSLLARIEGDEFALLLYDLQSSEEAAKAAMALKAAFGRPSLVEGHEISMTFSIGISQSPLDGDDVDSLLRHADLAASLAKAEGGNGYHFFRSEMGIEASERVALRAQLKHAIKHDEFVVHYQPVIDIASHRIVSMESLVRWNHPKLGMVQPPGFIPLAEESGLIVPIGEFVLSTACRQNKRWQGSGCPPLVVSVNLSARQFRAKNIVEVIVGCLRDSGLAPVYLEVEVTESTAMQDIDYTTKVLHELATLGIRIAIDDFGTGYSSFYYLKKFPLHTLKIDQAFIKDVAIDSTDAAIVKAIIGMSHGLGLKVVAEGVELETQYNFLRDVGCDSIQGFYFSEALAGKDFIPFLNNWSTVH